VPVCLKTEQSWLPKQPASLKIKLCPMNKVGRVNIIHSFFSPFSTHDDLVMQALVWLHMIQFRAIPFDVAWSCCALHM